MTPLDHLHGLQCVILAAPACFSVSEALLAAVLLNLTRQETCPGIAIGPSQPPHIEDLTYRSDRAACQLGS